MGLEAQKWTRQSPVLYLENRTPASRRNIYKVERRPEVSIFVEVAGKPLKLYAQTRGSIQKLRHDQYSHTGNATIPDSQFPCGFFCFCFVNILYNTQERLLGAALGSMLTGVVVFEQRRSIYKTVSDTQSQLFPHSQVKFSTILAKYLFSNPTFWPFGHIFSLVDKF